MLIGKWREIGNPSSERECVDSLKWRVLPTEKVGSSIKKKERCGGRGDFFFFLSVIKIYTAKSSQPIRMVYMSPISESPQASKLRNSDYWLSTVLLERSMLKPGPLSRTSYSSSNICLMLQSSQNQATWKVRPHWLCTHTHKKKKAHYNHCIVPDLIQKYKTNVYVAWLGHPAYEPRVLVPLYVCEAKTHHRKMPCTGYWGSYRINKRAKRRRITVRLA